MSLHIFSRRALPQWSSLAQLQTDLATGSYGRRGQALYQVGKEGDDSAVIGQWRYDGTVVRPIGPLDLTAAAWGYATVAGVVGAAVTVDASPTLGTSGTLRAWDVSAGASLGDVAYTRSGTAVTLTAGALAGLAAGDVLYEVVGGRTGALDISATGEIRPQAGCRALPLATGLDIHQADCLIVLRSTLATYASASVSATLSVSNASATNNSRWTIGLTAAPGAPRLGFGAILAAGAWTQHLRYGNDGISTVNYAAIGNLATGMRDVMQMTAGAYSCGTVGHSLSVLGKGSTVNALQGPLTALVGCYLGSYDAAGTPAQSLLVLSLTYEARA